MHRQTEMPVHGATRSPAFVDRALIQKCPNAHQAVLLQIQLSGLTDESICDDLRMDRGHFSRCRTATAHFPTAKLGRLQELCGNTALAQWLAMQAGCELRLIDAMRDRIDKLEAELQALKGAA